LLRHFHPTCLVGGILFTQARASSHEGLAALRGADLPSTAAIADINGFMK
jgi:hypothetical protein